MLDALTVALASGPVACTILWICIVINVALNHPEYTFSGWLVLAALGLLAPIVGFMGGVALPTITLPFGILMAIVLHVFGRGTYKPGWLTRSAAIVVGSCYGPFALIVILPIWERVLKMHEPVQLVTPLEFTISAITGSLVSLFLPWRLISIWRADVDMIPPPPMPTDLN